MNSDEFEKYIHDNYSKTWEDQQQTTFTAWCNAHLRKANMKIEVFEQDFRNGLRLIKLLEIISNDTLPPPDKGKMRFHKIANVHKALKFIEEKGVKIDSVGAEEIVDGNIKMTLGMIWTIILRFTIQDIHVEDSSAKEGLLLWCKRKTNAYKNIRVDNFKNGFQNGLAFCALIHSHDPSLIDYDSLSPNNARSNLTLAFTVAEEKLDVPQMLSVDAMINNEDSDERSIMAYVSSYYHSFNRKDKVNAALTNICGIINSRIEENKYSIDYGKLANDLLKWIEAVSIEFKDCNDIDDPSSLTSKLKWFEEYKFLDKPKNTGCHMKLQFETIHNEPLRMMEETIRSRWSVMEQLERVYESHLSDQRHRLQHIDNLLSKFEINYQFQRAWIGAQIAGLLSKDYETMGLSQLRTLARIQDTFITTVASQQSRTDKVVNIANELRRLHYNDMKTLNEKVDLILGPWDSLGSLNDQRVRSINMYISVLTQVDDLQLEFAIRATSLYNWIQQANQDLNDKFILHFIDEIKDLITAQENFKQTVVEAVDEFNEVKFMDEKIDSVVINNSLHQKPCNPYTDLTIKVLGEAWILLERNILERDAFLRDSLARRISSKECHADYIREIEKVSSALLDIQRTLFDSLSLTVGPDRRLTTLRNLQNQLSNVEVMLRSLEVVYRKLDAYSRLDDSVSIVSFEQMVIVHDILGHVISETMTSCTTSCNDVTDGQGIHDLPPNKIHEYEACFRHFDRNNSGQLDVMQFRACLVSLGFALAEDNQDNRSFELIVAEVDPHRTGRVSLRNYLEFMNQRNNYKGQSSERLMESFRILSGNQPWISHETIRLHLPSAVANYCLKNMKPTVDNDMRLDYKDFVMRLYQGRPGPRLPGNGYPQ